MGEAVGDVSAQSEAVDGHAAVGNRVGQQLVEPLFARLLAYDGDRGGDIGMSVENRFHFAQARGGKPRTFTWLSIRPTNSSRPSATPTDQIAGPVQPATRYSDPKAVRDETLRREVRPGQISLRDAESSYQQLSGHTVWKELTVSTDDVDRCVDYRRCLS